ncbi:MAG: four helix bundle protein [Opitutales bacterium]
MMQSFKDLIAWQEAMNLVELVYRETKTFPKEELFGLTSQTRRSAVSIPANIAEGYGRESRKEYLQFLAIARGSLTELETHLLIATRVNYLAPETMNKLQPQLTSVGKLLTALRKSLM